MKEDNVWRRFFLPFQDPVENLQLPEECLELRHLQKKYEEANNIMFLMDVELFDKEDIEKVDDYLQECKRNLEQFIINTKMTEEMVSVALEMEKLNMRNDKVKIILKKIHPTSVLSDYFLQKQKNLHENIKKVYENVKNVGSL